MKRSCNALARILFNVQRKLLTLVTLLFLTAFSFGDKSGRANLDSWAPVHEYIASHAIYVAPGTEEKLFMEATLGVETWELIGGAKNASRRDVGGGGWPATGEVILVNTLEEAETLASLIRAATYGD